MNAIRPAGQGGSSHAVRKAQGGLITAAAAGFLVLFFGVGLAAFIHFRRTPAPQVQPVGFNHRLHVEDEGMDCTECHMSVETETFAGLPDAGLCSLCHAELLGNGREEQKLVALIQEDEPLVWKSLFREAPHVFFSHRRHVSVAGLDCTVCHGDFAANERPPLSAELIRMQDCIACHEQEGASADCSQCHR